MESPYQDIIENHSIYMSVKDDEGNVTTSIEISPDGFFYNDKFIEDDYEVYEKFKEFIMIAHKREFGEKK